MPTFYKGNMYVPFTENGNEVELKLYIDGKWQYKKFALRQQDLKYIRDFRDANMGKLQNPVLEYIYGRFQLRYGIKILGFTLPEGKKIKDRKVMAVDLGINSDAACTVMCGDGTIVAREFINFVSEKAGLYTLLGRKKKLQSMSGNYKFAPVKKIVAKINGINDNLCNQTVAKIIKFARNYGVDVVVFEHLDFKGSSYGEKVHYYRKKSIISKVCSKLHLYNIRYDTVCAWNTSALAFDGSGKVKRDKDNHALCTFTTGKRYNCDLSASYNIAAR